VQIFKPSQNRAGRLTAALPSRPLGDNAEVSVDTQTRERRPHGQAGGGGAAARRSSSAPSSSAGSSTRSTAAASTSSSRWLTSGASAPAAYLRAAGTPGLQAPVPWDEQRKPCPAPFLEPPNGHEHPPSGVTVSLRPASVLCSLLLVLTLHRPGQEHDDLVAKERACMQVWQPLSQQPGPPGLPGAAWAPREHGARPAHACTGMPERRGDQSGIG